MTIDTAVLLWLVGALIGSMLFFAVTVAPTVFQALPAQHAGTFLRAFFPKYYLWGLVFAVLATLVALASNLGVSLVCAVVAVLFVYTRQTLMPQINRARDNELKGVIGAPKHFKKLHLRSVVINGLQLILLLGVAAYYMLSI